jgi:hypothetical protein
MRFPSSLRGDGQIANDHYLLPTCCVKRGSEAIAGFEAVAAARCSSRAFSDQPSRCNSIVTRVRCWVELGTEPTPSSCAVGRPNTADLSLFPRSRSNGAQGANGSFAHREDNSPMDNWTRTLSFRARATAQSPPEAAAPVGCTQYRGWACCAAGLARRAGHHPVRAPCRRCIASLFLHQGTNGRPIKMLALIAIWYP